MTRPEHAAEDQVRRLRSGAQLLHRPRRLPPAALVRHLTGVQAQVLSAAGLALRARGAGLTAPEVDRARLGDRTVVLSWAMRGTLHLVSTQDFGWLLPPVIEPQVPNAYRRLQQEGVPAGQAADALRSLQQMLEREGPLTRREMAERLRARGVRVQGQAIAHLVWLAAAQGIVCFGPDRAREQCFVLVRDWIGEPEPMERDAALAELAARYLGAHHPAAPSDLAAWSGLGQRDAKRAWRLIEDRLVEVETTQGTLWSLRTTPDPAPAGLVRLLPAFDEYLLGWRGRDLTVGAEHRTRINRGGGWLHPVVLVDGRAAGTWRTERVPGALRLRVEAFTELDAAVRDRVLVEARELSTFLGHAVEVVLA
ncbi:MAG: winged helix DNA-binding domain-containing protein [Candidatus Dormibacteraeota bacterium]|nr:winged helix DNA-binding domain-containing protein [Candidatus Dormibacteraeota bacterium]